MSAEARARVAAEAALLRRHRQECERLLKKKSRAAAIVALVERHKVEYGELVRAARARFERAESAA